MFGLPTKDNSFGTWLWGYHHLQTQLSLSWNGGTGTSWMFIRSDRFIVTSQRLVQPPHRVQHDFLSITQLHIQVTIEPSIHYWDAINDSWLPINQSCYW